MAEYSVAMDLLAAGQPLTPAEVAAVFRVDAKSVSRWAKNGELDSFTTPGGHRRFPATAVLARLMSGTERAEQGGPAAGQ